MTENKEINILAKKKGGYKCNSCSEIFTSLKKYAAHLDKYNHQFFNCYKCKINSCIYSIFGFSEKDGLVQHIKEHGPRSQRCGICGIGSHRRWGMKKHILQHIKKTAEINAIRISFGEPPLFARENVFKIHDMLN